MILLFFIHFLLACASPAIHGTPQLRSARYKVLGLPGFDDINDLLKPVMYAGHIEVHPENNTNYFFWKFEEKLDSQDKLVFWFNGGPGCSSMDGALMESGPLRVDEKLKVHFNNGTWLELATMVFLDQPVGSGFSYGDIFHKELTGVSWDFLAFLGKYFDLFPKDITKKMYFAGESYAGQYMPYFAKQILEYNRNSDRKYNLQGLLIGNGYVSPSTTGLSFVEYALKTGMIVGNEPFMPGLLSAQENCQNHVNRLSEDAGQMEKNKVNFECDQIVNNLIDGIRKSEDNGQCINIYDVRLTDSYPSCGMNWPQDIPFVTQFLSDADNQLKLNLNPKFITKEKSLNHGSTKWSECNHRVSETLLNEHSPSSEEFIAEILNEIPVVMFNGDQDLLCNYIGAERFIDDLSWNGLKGFSNLARRSSWHYNNTQVGEILSERNLTYIKVFNASHMVPFDLPDVSRGVLDIMTKNFEEKGLGIWETPVYNVSSSKYLLDHLKNKSKGHFYDEYLHFRYLVYLVLLVAIMYMLYYYNQKHASNRPHSILTNKDDDSISLASVNILNGRRKLAKKKSVQWADLQLPDNLSRPAPSRVSNLLSRVGLGRRGTVKYHRPSNFDLEEEIEMVDQLDNLPDNQQFTISNEEDDDDGDLGR